MAMAATATYMTGSSTVHGVSDNEKRWVVYGCVLNKILIPQVRSFVESEVEREYGSLKTSHAVDTQSTPGRLIHWPSLPPKQIFLKYENINGNDALPKKHGKYDYSTFDCRVASHVDFAKLYVENFMAKFNAFDEHCDASAVLSLLCKVPVFSAAIQSAAGDVRQARNAWAHCAFSNWDPVKFRKRFYEMEELVKVLRLLSADKAKLLADLKDWETKGTSFCMNAPVDPALLQLVQHHVSALKTDVDKIMSFEVEDDRKEVKKALQDVSAHLDELEKRVSIVEQGVKHVEIEQSTMGENVKALKSDVDDVQQCVVQMEESMSDLQQRSVQMEESMSDLQQCAVQVEESMSDLQQRSVQMEESINDLQQRVVHTEERISSVTPQISWEIASCEADIAFFAERHDPHTRQWLFDDFDKWFRDPGDSRAYVLLGDAGVGKSVIAGALAKRTRDAVHLGAAYFCRHNDGTRNDPRYLLGTVACQLCNCNSQYTNMVGGEGGVKTMLANSKLGVQELFTKLLEEPLAKCTPLRERMLVIIDALDETEYESREDFLELIKERFPRLPDWLVFFITSRPEDTVHSRLERYNPCVRICAGDSEQHSFYEQHEQDIRRFLENGVNFSRFSNTVEEVTKKCNGLFLYAFYIKKELQELSDQMHSGKHNQIGDLFPEDIKDFFQVNFQRVYDKVGEDLYEKLIGCVLAAPSPLPVSFIPFVLKKEKSTLGEQGVIDAVLQFSLNQTANDTVSFLHKLIPTWLTKTQEGRKDQIKAKKMRRDSPRLLINKEKAGEYLKSIFSEILSATVDESSPLLSSVDVDLQNYVERVAPRFMCQLGNKDSLNVVFRCLTNYQFLQKRIESGRMEIYRLLEDLKLAANCSTLEDEHKQNVLQEISLALESNVYILLECPHLVHVCLLNTSNSAKETVLIPQKSGPRLDWRVVDLSCTAHLSGFTFFGTSSDKKIVAGAKGRFVLFVDPYTFQVLYGPFEVSQDTIKCINHLEFSSDDKYVFFGRLDKWLLVSGGFPEDLPQFGGNSTIYDWGVLTPDKQWIVVKRASQGPHFDLSGTCEDKCCLSDLLVLWAVKEIDSSSFRETICPPDPSRLVREIKTTSKKLIQRFLQSLQWNTERFLVTTVPYGGSCCYCREIRKLTEKIQEASLADVRRLVVELYPHIFQYQVWNLQTGRSPLQDVLSLKFRSLYVQLDPLFYFYHVIFAFRMWGMEVGCSGMYTGSIVCNIAVANAARALSHDPIELNDPRDLEYWRKEYLSMGPGLSPNLEFTSEQVAECQQKELTIKRSKLLDQLLWIAETRMQFSKFMTSIFSSSVIIRSVSCNSSVFLWRITDQGVCFILESSMAGSHRGALHNCVLSPNGKLTAFHRGNEVGLYISLQVSKEEPCIIYKQDHSFTVVFAFSADSSLLYICIQESMGTPCFYLWDVEKKVCSATFKPPGLLNVECFCISPDGRKLILCGGYDIEILEFDKQLPCRFLAIAGVERPYKSVKFSQCAVSSDGELLVCCFVNTVYLFRLCVPDIVSSKQLLRGHLGRIDFCKFLKVNRYLITYGVDGLVILWDLSEAKAATFARITQSHENIISMAVSPEEDRAVCFTSCDRVCLIELRRLENALPLKLLTAPGNGPVDRNEENGSQLEEAFSSTPNPLTSSTDDEELSSSDSEGDMDYYLEHEDVDELD